MKKCLPITAKLNRMQKPYNGSSGPNVSPDGDMISSPAKMYNSPNKMKDLSGDGKITKKDVLIGRGVIKKDESPAKMCGGKKKKY